MSDTKKLKAELEAFAGFIATEIAGSGMISGDGRPDMNETLDNRPRGTVYKDKSITDGAALWLKTGNGRQWKVIGGDTGWIKLKRTRSMLETSHIRIRRINDTVYYEFGGGQWGWFGTVRRGGKNFEAQRSFKDKGCRIVGLGGIPDGFRSAGSQVVSMYKDGAAVYGTVYLGGMSDSNFIALGFLEDIPTDRDINDIRISPLSYTTDQPWPKLNVLQRNGYL